MINYLNKSVTADNNNNTQTVRTGRFPEESSSGAAVEVDVVTVIDSVEELVDEVVVLLFEL